ncbi:MAG: flippase-like domain-containing protein, partial [Rubrobacter sp.]|nr:flippase-like domain-containing protein [Rubrobacter sp.]
MERLKKNFILALVLGLAVYLVLAIVSGLEDLRDALSGFDFFLIPAILGLVSLSYAVRFVRWTYYLRLLKVRVPLRANAAIFAAGLSMTISPGKLGEVLKSVFIKDVVGTPVARTAPAVVAERATDGTGMVLWGLLGALAFSFGPWLLLLFLALTGVGIAVLRSRRLSLLA